MPASATPAERMRASRDRKRQGLVAVYVELHSSDIAGLIRAGYLDPAKHRDRTALTMAMGALLDAMPHDADGVTIWPVPAQVPAPPAVGPKPAPPAATPPPPQPDYSKSRFVR